MNDVELYLDHLLYTKGMFSILCFRKTLITANTSGYYTEDLNCVDKWLMKNEPPSNYYRT